LTFTVYDQHSDDATTLFEGTSTNQFTITGSENIEFNPIF